MSVSGLELAGGVSAAPSMIAGNVTGPEADRTSRALLRVLRGEMAFLGEEGGGRELNRCLAREGLTSLRDSTAVPRSCQCDAKKRNGMNSQGLRDDPSPLSSLSASDLMKGATWPG